MEKSQRLVGIDLIRGIAAYGVAILHSGDVTTAISVSFWATQVQRFCGFAVPFFLIASFYLSIKKIYITGKTFSLQSRFQRLIIPYFIWSLLYVLMRLAKFYILKETINSEKVTDIVAIVFLGSAGIQLYFIPLLFSGTLFLVLIAKLISEKTRLIILLFLFLFSCIADHFVFFTGNSFKLNSYIAFDNLAAVIPNLNNNPLIRVTLAFIALLVRCLPYIFAATIINNILLRDNYLKLNQNAFIISLATFLGLSLLGFVGIDINLPIYVDNRSPVYEVAKAIPLLIAAIYLSFYLPSFSIFKSLGDCTFGIFLMHQSLIQILRIPMIKIFPDFVNNVSISTQLFFASLSFGTAWVVTSLLMRKKIFSKLLFGV